MTDSTTQPARDGGALPSILGVTLYSRTVATVRYAKDSDKAPTMASRVALLRMSAEQVAAIGRLEELATERGIDAWAASEPFVGALGDFDERLRPQDWSERLVKTYLGMGLLTDFCMALAGLVPEGPRAALLEALASDRFGEFAAAELLEDVDGDPQLSARLGLWGRRVLGEEIGTLQRIIVRFPELVPPGVDPAVLHDVLSSGATTRMSGLGLRV